MDKKEGQKKRTARFVVLNIVAMIALVAALSVGVKLALAAYTRHGEKIAVPNLYHKTMDEAVELLSERGLVIEVEDSGYQKSLPAGCILDQRPASGQLVKDGRTIYVTINSSRTPELTIPDVIDNSSRREAEARMTAMGFKMGPPRYVYGEKDWVLGAFVGTRRVFAGERVSIEQMVSLEVGNGMISDEDSLTYVDADAYVEDEEETVEEDPFEVVTGTTGVMETKE